MIYLVKLILLPLLFGWQVQGGPRQDVQVTERTVIVQPATIKLIQGVDPDYESQPAGGYNVLDSTGQEIAILHGSL